MRDIFAFWKEVGPGEHVHPADKKVLGAGKHRLDLHCLPGPFYGSLRTASIVLLYLAPGRTRQDVADAKSESGRELIYRRLQGNQPLSGRNPNSWWALRTRCFELPPEKLVSQLAVLEICPYHSKSFHDWPLLAALPSSRAAITWAQEVLFPEARASKRIVICMRAARYWGLVPGQRTEGLLFAPQTTRHGHMMKTPMRKKIIKEVQILLGHKGRLV
jgi:hypothetical protein